MFLAICPRCGARFDPQLWSATRTGEAYRRRWGHGPYRWCSGQCARESAADARVSREAHGVR